MPCCEKKMQLMQNMFAEYTERFQKKNEVKKWGKLDGSVIYTSAFFKIDNDEFIANLDCV